MIILLYNGNNYKGFGDRFKDETSNISYSDESKLIFKPRAGNVFPEKEITVGSSAQLYHLLMFVKYINLKFKQLNGQPKKQQILLSLAKETTKQLCKYNRKIFVYHSKGGNLVGWHSELSIFVDDLLKLLPELYNELYNESLKFYNYSSYRQLDVVSGLYKLVQGNSTDQYSDQVEIFRMKMEGDPTFRLDLKFCLEYGIIPINVNKSDPWRRAAAMLEAAISYFTVNKIEINYHKEMQKLALLEKSKYAVTINLMHEKAKYNALLNKFSKYKERIIIEELEVNCANKKLAIDLHGNCIIKIRRSTLVCSKLEFALINYIDPMVSEMASGSIKPATFPFPSVPMVNYYGSYGIPATQPTARYIHPAQMMGGQLMAPPGYQQVMPMHAGYYPGSAHHMVSSYVRPIITQRSDSMVVPMYSTPIAASCCYGVPTMYSPSNYTAAMESRNLGGFATKVEESCLSSQQPVVPNKQPTTQISDNEKDAILELTLRELGIIDDKPASSNDTVIKDREVIDTPISTGTALELEQQKYNLVAKNQETDVLKELTDDEQEEPEDKSENNESIFSRDRSSIGPNEEDQYFTWYQNYPFIEEAEVTDVEDDDEDDDNVITTDYLIQLGLYLKQEISNNINTMFELQQILQSVLSDFKLEIEEIDPELESEISITTINELQKLLQFLSKNLLKLEQNLQKFLNQVDSKHSYSKELQDDMSYMGDDYSIITMLQENEELTLTELKLITFDFKERILIVNNKLLSLEAPIKQLLISASEKIASKHKKKISSVDDSSGKKVIFSSVANVIPVDELSSDKQVGEKELDHKPCYKLT